MGKHSRKKRASTQSIMAKNALSFVVMLVVVILACVGLRTFILGVYMVPSTSMEDTIEPSDRIFSEKVSLGLNDIGQGDVVTFVKPQCVRNEDGTYSAETYVKRVIAVGGQVVDIRNGQVYVDGELIDEPYLKEGSTTVALETPSDWTNKNPIYPYAVPEGHVWVMGDNRTHTADSRTFGPISIDSITGRAFFTYWPVSRIGVIE